MTAADGLSSNDVGAVVEDRAGRIYAGTARGIDRIELASGAGRITRYGPQRESRSVKLTRPCAIAPARMVRCQEWHRAVHADRRSTAAAAGGGDRRPHRERTAAESQRSGRPIWQRIRPPPGRTSLQVSYLTPGSGRGPRAISNQARRRGRSGVRPPTSGGSVTRTWVRPLSVRRPRGDVRRHAGRNAAGFEFRVLAPVWQRWWFLSTAAPSGGSWPTRSIAFGCSRSAGRGDPCPHRP